MFAWELMSSLFKNPSHVWFFMDPVVIMKEIMPWLLRIQLTVTWLNLPMPSQTVKNSLNTKKIELPQMNFVYEKQLIKFSCTYQPLSICKIFIKKILELIQNYDVRHFWDQRSSFVLNNFFGPKPLLLPSSIYGFFPFSKFIRNLKRIQNYDNAPFLGPKWSIYLK